MTSELRNRIVFGLLFAGLATAAVAADVRQGTHWGTTGLALIAVIVGSREYAHLASVVSPGFNLLPVMTANVLLALLPSLAHLGSAPAGFAGGDGAIVIIGVALGWVLLDQMFRRGPEGIFQHVGAAMLGIAYLGIPFLLLQRMAGMDRGGQLLLVFIAAVKFSDITAFIGGKLFGRHKMCPSISPGKTWEGFAASFVGAIGGSFLFAWLPTTWGSVTPFTGWWQPAVWGLILGPLGVLGDLAESCLKRAAGAKDSGRSMPGFGGILDVLDALIIAAPVAYLLAQVL